MKKRIVNIKSGWGRKWKARNELVANEVEDDEDDDDNEGDEDDDGEEDEENNKEDDEEIGGDGFILSQLSIIHHDAKGQRERMDIVKKFDVSSTSAKAE